jgi:hypothetical protein
MKSKSMSSAKCNSIDGQFNSLNNDEMTNLKGGTNPPLPPTGGDDYPIDLLNLSISSTTYSSKQLLPVLGKKSTIV